MILDAGEKSVAAINDWIDKAKTLVWNGPLGAFEKEPFDQRHRRHGEARREAYAGGKTPFCGGRRRHRLRAKSCRRCW